MNLFLALAICVWNCSGDQPDSRQVRIEIQHQYDRWSKAYMTQDVNVLLEILSPDYSLTTGDKDELSYKTYAAYLKLKAKGPKDITHYKTIIKSFNLSSSTADVVAIETMTTELADRTNAKGQLSVHQHEYLDRWQSFDHTWRLLKTTTLHESTKIERKG